MAEDVSISAAVRIKPETTANDLAAIRAMVKEQLGDLNSNLSVPIKLDDQLTAAVNSLIAKLQTSVIKIGVEMVPIGAAGAGGAGGVGGGIAAIEQLATAGAPMTQYEEAVRAVLESQKGSVAMLQRRLTIGYSKAKELIDTMIDDGIVASSKDPGQPRKVLMTLDQWTERNGGAGAIEQMAMAGNSGGGAMTIPRAVEEEREIIASKAQVSLMTDMERDLMVGGAMVGTGAIAAAKETGRDSMVAGMMRKTLSANLRKTLESGEIIDDDDDEGEEDTVSGIGLGKGIGAGGLKSLGGKFLGASKDMLMAHSRLLGIGAAFKTTEELFQISGKSEDIDNMIRDPASEGGGIEAAKLRLREAKAQQEQFAGVLGNVYRGEGHIGDWIRSGAESIGGKNSIFMKEIMPWIPTSDSPKAADNLVKKGEDEVREAENAARDVKNAGETTRLQEQIKQLQDLKTGDIRAAERERMESGLTSQETKLKDELAKGDKSAQGRLDLFGVVKRRSEENFDADTIRQKEELEQTSADRIQAIRDKANQDMLRASGHAVEADRDAFVKGEYAKVEAINVAIDAQVNGSDKQKQLIKEQKAALEGFVAAVQSYDQIKETRDANAHQLSVEQTHADSLNAAGQTEAAKDASLYAKQLSEMNVAIARGDKPQQMQDMANRHQSEANLRKREMSDSLESMGLQTFQANASAARMGEVGNEEALRESLIKEDRQWAGTSGQASARANEAAQLRAYMASLQMKGAGETLTGSQYNQRLSMMMFHSNGDSEALAKASQDLKTIQSGDSLKSDLNEAGDKLIKAADMFAHLPVIGVVQM